MKQNWDEYKEYLKFRGLTEEQIEDVRRIRENEEYNHVTYEQFMELWRQGVIRRTRKLKKPRNLFLCKEGRFWYFEFYYKKWQYAGYFLHPENSQ